MLPPRSFSSLVSQIFQEPILAHILSYLSSDVSRLHLSGLVSYSYIQTIQ